MLFNSPEFILGFLPITLLGYYLLALSGRSRLVMCWLTLASLFFYGWWNISYVALLLCSVTFNFLMGHQIVRHRKKYLGRVLLIIGIATNLGVLGYFKYADFFVENFNYLFQQQLNIGDIVLPLAISFFTFQQITYLADSLAGSVGERDPLSYSLFVLFFPQLIAGPIVHHQEMLPQFDGSRVFSFDQTRFTDGLTIFFLGLFKKVVFADTIAQFSSPVFRAAKQGIDISFFEAWSGALGYTFQLYFDFSGYSDMAVGIALMFGIVLPLNFNSPYKATSVIEFWRRWHITLSRFLKDYLYIPLGGNRKGPSQRQVNLLITMLLGGLWHGANWTFVAWGALHGFYLIVNHSWAHINDRLSLIPRDNLIWRWLCWIITFIAVMIGWVLFRAESFPAAINILKGMIGLQGVVLPAQIASAIPGLENWVQTVGAMKLLGGGTVMGIVEMCGMFFIMFAVIAGPNLYQMSRRLRAIAIVMTFYLTVQTVFFFRTPSEFLYFQF